MPSPASCLAPLPSCSRSPRLAARTMRGWRCSTFAPVDGRRSRAAVRRSTCTAGAHPATRRISCMSPTASCTASSSIPVRLEAIGQPVRLDERVMVKTTGAANYVVSRPGSLVYLPHGTHDRNGEAATARVGRSHRARGTGRRATAPIWHPTAFARCDTGCGRCRGHERRHLDLGRGARTAEQAHLRSWRGLDGGVGSRLATDRLHVQSVRCAEPVQSGHGRDRSRRSPDNQ